MSSNLERLVDPNLKSIRVTVHWYFTKKKIKTLLFAVFCLTSVL